MANWEHDKVQCPHCNKTMKLKVWNIIDIQENPELWGQVRDKSAFITQCPHCDHTFTVDYEVLYHQPEDKLMIYCVPDEVNYNNSYEIMEEKGAACFGIPPTESRNYVVRLVDNQNDLVEKLAIFDAGYDDRIMEVTKALYLANLWQEQPDIHVDQVHLYRDENEEYRLVFMSDDQSMFTMAMTPEVYHTTVNHFGAKARSAEYESVVVDLEWALGILEE